MTRFHRFAASKGAIAPCEALLLSLLPLREISLPIVLALNEAETLSGASALLTVKMGLLRFPLSTVPYRSFLPPRLVLSNKTRRDTLSSSTTTMEIISE